MLASIPKALRPPRTGPMVAALALLLLLSTAPPAVAQVTQGEFAERRAALLYATEARVGLAISNPTSRQGHLPFQYLAGVIETDAVLLFVREGDGVTSTIFVPEGLGRERGALPLVGVDGAPFRPGDGTRGQAPEVRSLEELTDTLGPLLDLVDRVALVGVSDFAAGGSARGPEVVGALLEGREELEIVRANGQVNQMRAIKSPAELQLIRRAVEITEAAHRELLNHIRPGVTEADLKVVIDSVFRAMGADARPAFGHIVASAENSTILHYRGGERVLNDGEHVKIDIGAQVHGYAADVTRTYPVNGRFSPELRDIYEIVRAAQARAEELAAEGAPRAEQSRAADLVLGEGLTRLGLMEGPGATYDCAQRGGGMGECPQLRIHYFHSLGHGIGLNVHDPTPGTMEVGSAISIEPGIYLRPGFLDDLPDTPRNRALLERIGAAYERYEGIGVRIEDNHIMTPEGLVWISRAPREIDEIEAAMAAAARERAGR